MHPDYVYSRRPNGSRKSGGGGGGSASTSGHRRRASSATPSSSGSTTGGGTAADLGESASMLSHTLSLSSPPSTNHHTTPGSHRGKTRSRPLAGSKGAGTSGGGGHHSGVRSSDSEKSAFSPGYESNTSDAEMGNLHMPMPMPMPTHLSQSFSFPSSAGTTAAAAREGDAAGSFRSLAAGYEPQLSSSNNLSSASESMDCNAPPPQQAQISSSTSSAPGYLETHMSATPQDYRGPQNAVQSFEEQLLSQPISSGSQTMSHGQPSGSASQASLQSSVYPSSSITQQQIPPSNIFATPEPRQQQSFAAVSNQGQDHTVQEHARPLTSQSGYSQATSYQALAHSGNQARPSSTSRFGIHSFRNAGHSSARPSTSLGDQHDVKSYGEESMLECDI